MDRPERRFQFRLSRHLGMTRGEMMARMSSVELMEQMAMEEFDPFPDPLWNAAKVCATIYNANRAGKGRMIKPEDIIPLLKGPGRGQSEESQALEMKLFMEGS